MDIIKAKYRAKTPTGSTVVIETELSLELSQMVAWIMHHQADALELLPTYDRLRIRSIESYEAQRADYWGGVAEP